MDFLKWHAAFRQEVAVQIICDLSLLVTNCKFNTFLLILASIKRVLLMCCYDHKFLQTSYELFSEDNSNLKELLRLILTLDFMYLFDIKQINHGIWHSLFFITESHLAKFLSITSFATHWSSSMECTSSSWVLIFNLKLGFTMFLIDSYFKS